MYVCDGWTDREERKGTDECVRLRLSMGMLSTCRATVGLYPGALTESPEFVAPARNSYELRGTRAFPYLEVS